MKFNIALPQDILLINKIFKENNYNLFLVGGAVRDAVLNKPIKDYDLATDALPDKVELILNNAGLRTVATGKAFGVINVFTKTNEYEIATFRKDLSKGRRPDAVEFTDINTDVQRRDLTINGLFYNIDTKEIVDLVGGLDDLKNGIIKSIGDPVDRFDEDKLRVLRALRFAGKFGSALDPKIDAALKKGISLDGVSPERIRDEFLKGIKTSKSVKYFLQLISDYKLWQQIFPGLEINSLFIENRDEIIVLSILLHAESISLLAKKLNELTYSTNEITGITFLQNLVSLKPDNAVTLKRQQKNSGVSTEQITIFAKFRGLSTKLIQVFNAFILTVNGNDLMQSLNLKPGVELGKAIMAQETENFKKLL